MNKNPSLVRTSAWQRISLIVLGVVLSFVFIEIGMRLGGFILLSIQEHGNLRVLKQKGAYRILCLGESTTQGQYPQFLEQALNRSDIGVRFNVIDKGRAGANTGILLKRIDADLAEYRPSMVIAMMGINDRGVKYYQDISSTCAWAFEHC